jgi:hypothetical protein
MPKIPQPEMQRTRVEGKSLTRIGTVPEMGTRLKRNLHTEMGVRQIVEDKDKKREEMPDEEELD